MNFNRILSYTNFIGGILTLLTASAVLVCVALSSALPTALAVVVSVLVIIFTGVNLLALCLYFKDCRRRTNNFTTCNVKK